MSSFHAVATTHHPCRDCCDLPNPGTSKFGDKLLITVSRGMPCLSNSLCWWNNCAICCLCCSWYSLRWNSKSSCWDCRLSTSTLCIVVDRLVLTEVTKGTRWLARGLERNTLGCCLWDEGDDLELIACGVWKGEVVKLDLGLTLDGCCLVLARSLWAKFSDSTAVWN